ncbi:MAG: N-acetylmuramoyl-L-alanine amidase [Paludibacteraceae bacterium]|nr:N-acetylmuramoyl-L-alanine amidase [Paludibacteraceae bacterium]
MLRKLSLLVLLTAGCLSANAFTLVIDAGHGGKDAGAVGASSYEKNINLTYALALGEKVKANCPDVKIIYTRTTDVFVELNERARIANQAAADLFISIHTNASKNPAAQGMETFTLGASRNKETMEVAMFENSVILQEEDYATHYQGFDPNSTDSYIMFEFMKDEFMERSIRCADYMQSRMIKRCKRVDRGVRQAGFLVLRATSMPSILVELGFISNKEDEKYLNTPANVPVVVQSMYEGFLAYKNSLGGKSEPVSEPAPQPSTAPVTTPAVQPEPAAPQPVETPAADSTLVFHVQLLVSGKQLPLNDPVFKGLTDVECIREDGFYKYVAGRTQDVDQAFRNRNAVLSQFPDAFLTAHQGGRKVPVQEAVRIARSRQ